MKCKIFFLFIWVIGYGVSCREQDDNPITRSTIKNNTAPTNEPELITISNRPLNGDTAQIRLLIDEGNALRNNTPERALSNYRQAYYLSKKTNYYRGTALALLNIGELYNDKKDYRGTRTFYQRAIPYGRLANEQNKKLNLLPDIYDAIGRTYFLEAKNDSAIQMYLQALRIIQRKLPTDTLRLMSLYNNIGSAMESMDEQYDRTLQYYRKALDLGLQYKKDTIRLALIFKNVGIIYEKKENHDSALYAFNQALHLYSLLHSPKDIQDIYTSISSIWLHEGNRAKGKHYLDSAIHANPSGVFLQPGLLINISHIYYHDGDLENAILYAEKALALYKKSVENNKLGIYIMLAKMYDTLGQGHMAYHYAKAYAQLKDSILDKDKIKTLNQAETKYRISEKNKELIQKQLLIAQQQNKIQQQYLWIGVAVVALMLFSILYYRKQHKAAIAQFKAKQDGEEKERLRMAAELHDGIVSRLSSVKMSFDAIRPSGPSNTVDAMAFNEAFHLLDQSIVEIRSTSQNLHPSILKQAGLASAIDIYCQTISKITPLYVDFQMVGTLPSLKEDFQLNIYRMIQELANNIVKHAQATTALIQFSVHSGRLTIIVEDNGIGIPAAQPDDKNGIGLHNLHNRLLFLHGTMEITIKNGTSIHLEFDLKHYIES